MSCETLGNFNLGGVEVPLFASLGINQTYENIGGFLVRRTMDGSAIKQQQWTKLSTSVSGRGSIPAGFDELDFTQPLLMRCIGVRGITSADNVVELPAARRSDTGFEPSGFARLNGEFLWQSTTINIVGDTATLGIVSGAAQYRVEYFPEFTVFSNPPRIDVDERGKELSWTINAEEV